MVLSRSIYSRLLSEARQALPNECCGLLGGREGQVTEMFPATNSLASPAAYEIPPEELFDIFRKMRAGGLSLTGIYHSHPAGENVPSRRDHERAFYPEAAYFIVSPAPDNPMPVRAFRLAGDAWQEIGLRIES